MIAIQAESILAKSIYRLMEPDEAVVIKHNNENYFITKNKESIMIDKVTEYDDVLLQNANDGEMFFIEE